ncbi:MAG: glycosyltransferase [Anaerolineales bacterium]|nr:glycosyltransferase [Anaerolineales bacterium]
MRFTIVTPSFNQNRFLQRSMRSVLGQEVEDLEYIVIDGGSTDGSVETIKKEAARLAFWRSRPDRGYADALHEGFGRSTGEIMGWLNSDDMLTPWALRAVESIFRALPEVEWITTLYPLVMNEEGMVIAARQGEGYNAGAFYRGRNVPLSPRFYTSVIQQESTFWRRSLWERAGARMDDSLRMAGDFELWARFFQHGALHAVGIPIGCFRFQKQSFTSNAMAGYLDECRTVLRRYRYKPPSGVETAARRIARVLPRRFYRLTGMAYPVSKIRQEGRGSEWIVYRDWIL